MKKLLASAVLLFCSLHSLCWGFYGHQKINYYAVFLLPPEMIVLYKRNIRFLCEHSVDPDKRRYAVPEEGPRHYIDLDRYGQYPFDSLPRKWEKAVEVFSEDTLMKHGIVPWHIEKMLLRLTRAFTEKNFDGIMKYSAEIGHYISDAHVPLHACSNHNGQYSNQRGIHGFWESRIPELLAESEFDFLIGRAVYLKDPSGFIWKKVIESAAASDTVLFAEKELSMHWGDDRKFAFEERNGNIMRQYSTAFTVAYDKRLGGMTERRMRESIFAVASFWFTAWVNAGQPDLKELTGKKFSLQESVEIERLNEMWKTGGSVECGSGH